ncbi:hypothetical protein TB2_032373 [Malus domestica]
MTSHGVYKPFANGKSKSCTVVYLIGSISGLRKLGEKMRNIFWENPTARILNLNSITGNVENGLQQPILISNGIHSRLRVVSCKDRCEIRLEDPNSSELFAAYFMLKIEDGKVRRRWKRVTAEKSCWWSIYLPADRIGGLCC